MAKKVKNIKKAMIKRVTLDPLYKSYWYSKFINKLMLDGKKHVIEKIMSRIWYNLTLKYNAKPIDILFMSLIRLKPLIGTTTKRIGKVWKTVPVPLQPRRQLVIALKWLVSQIKIEPELHLSAKITRTLSGFVQKNTKKRKNRKTDVLKKKNLHYANVVKDRVNMRYRWC